MKYQEMQAYGFNIIIKKYCNFPIFLPLPCHMEHGWTPFLHPLKSDLTIAQDKKLMLVFSKRRAESWKKFSNTLVEIMGAPFIHFRRMNGIKQNENARGTVAFPSHSTELIDSKFAISNYCKQLKELPNAFKPITICLHCVDIKKAVIKFIKKKGLL